MLAFLLRRCLWAVLLLVVMSLFMFVLFFVVPPETTQTGRGGAGADISLREAYGLERASLPAEYAEWLRTVVVDRSLGASFTSSVPVGEVLASALPVTLSVLGGGALLFLLLATPVGILSALRPRSLFDRLAMILVIVGVSAHPAWIGLILIYLFGVKWDVFPVGGYCDAVHAPSGLECGGPADWAYHLVLPWVTFAVLFAALYARMIRATVTEALEEDYVRTARAKGAPGWVLLRSHVLRNALLPVVTMLGMDLGIAFGGAVFVEQVFGLPGMGRLAVQSMARRDLPVLMGVTLTVTTAIVLLNLVVDVLYARLDPRVHVARSRARGPLAAGEPAARPEAAPAPGVSV